jgi:Fur family ferric uptake transcriptional regulator
MSKEIEEKLVSKDIRPTAMRQLVLQVLMQQESAISLSELELEFEHADKSTLFRTLKTFEDKKLIHSIDDGTGSLKYALCKSTCVVEHRDQHVHFICSKYHHTYCLTDFEIPSVDLPTGFSLDSVNVVVKGICAHCS